MIRNKTLVAFITFVTSLAAAPAMAAGTACMNWQCDIATSTCTIDASCSTASPFIYKYWVDWGDGTTYYGGNSTVSHTYAYNPSSYFYTVTMGIVFWSEPTEDYLTCQLVYRQVPIGGYEDYAGNCSN